MCFGLRTSRAPPQREGSSPSRPVLPESQDCFLRELGSGGQRAVHGLPTGPDTELGGQRLEARQPRPGPSRPPGGRRPSTARLWFPINSSLAGSGGFLVADIFNAFKYTLQGSCQKDLALLTSQRPPGAGAEPASAVTVACPRPPTRAPVSPPPRPRHSPSGCSRAVTTLLLVASAPNSASTVAPKLAPAHSAASSRPAPWAHLPAEGCLGPRPLLWPARAQVAQPEHRRQAHWSRRYRWEYPEEAGSPGFSAPSSLE